MLVTDVVVEGVEVFGTVDDDVDGVVWYWDKLEDPVLLVTRGVVEGVEVIESVEVDSELVKLEDRSVLVDEADHETLNVVVLDECRPDVVSGVVVHVAV